MYVLTHVCICTSTRAKHAFFYLKKKKSSYDLVDVNCYSLKSAHFLLLRATFHHPLKKMVYIVT